MPQLIDFLQALATNADLKAQFDEDPAACMRDYGLTEDEIALVLKGDVDKLKEYLGEDVAVISKHVVLGKR